MSYKKHFNQEGVAKGYTKFRFDLVMFGKRHRKMIVCQTGSVQKIYKVWEDQIYNGVTKQYSFFQIVDKYIEYLNKRVKSNDLSEAFYLNAVQRLDECKKFFKNVELNSIQRCHIDDLKLSLKSKGLKNGSINQYVCILRMFFNDCIDRNYYQGNNPASRQAEDDDSIRQIELTDEQVLEVLEKTKVKPTLHTCIMIALFSGMRRGEIFQLTWNDIDFVNEIIHIRKEITKTKTERWIPLATELKKHLLEVRLSSKSVRVISDYTYLKKISRVWNEFRHKIPCVNLLQEKYKLELRFHDLRHVFGQRLLNNNVDIYTISGWLGHSSVKMTQKRYVNIQNRGSFPQINVLNFQKENQILSQCQVNEDLEKCRTASNSISIRV